VQTRPIRSPRGAARRALLAAVLLVAVGCAGGRGTSPGAAPAAAPVPAPERRAFEVPGHGALELAVPRGWTADLRARRNEADPRRTLALRRTEGKAVAHLTPWGNPGGPEGAQQRADAARLLAELARRSALAGSVERQIPLERLEGDGVVAFWFAATDRDLAGRETGPDEFRHMLQGAAAVGPLLVAFTLLDDGPGPQRAELLGMLRGARHVPGGGDEPDAGFALDPGAETVPLVVRARGRGWSVLVDLPGFRMFAPREADDGVGVVVLGERPDTGVVASVILRRSGAALDAAGCREADLARIAAASGPERLARATAGEAARATYALSELRGQPLPQAHAHAWLFREGVCANVHVSKIAPAPEDAGRMEEILATARFGEDL
jgi:hypothetical protein